MDRRAFCLAIPALAAFRRPAVRIACLGEQTTHSLHRVNDPEFPLLLGEALDRDFKADPTPNPTAGGFFMGGGSHYRIGNFGSPNASVIDHALEKPQSLLRSPQLIAADAFAPDIVILGPFGEHEELTGLGMDHYAPDLKRLVERIRGFASRPRVFLLLPIPPFGRDDKPAYRQIRDATHEIARQTGQPIIDLWTPFLGNARLFKDPTHLTENGRRKLARIVARALRRRR